MTNRLNPIWRVSVLVLGMAASSAASAQSLFVPGGSVGNSSNGNVGIGTTAPDGQNSLHVKGSILAENGANASDTGRNRGFNVWDDEAFGIELHRDNSVGRWGTAIYARSDGDIRLGHYPANATAQSAFVARFVVTNQGNVGIGTSQPERPLHIRSSNALLRIDRNASAPGFVVGRYSPDWSTVYKAFQIYVDGNGQDSGEFGIADSHQQMGGGADIRFLINNVGNVGIGTTNPSHKLSVNGTIKAKEVIVETTGWSDYVFADDYRLAPLSEVEAHIKAERRLPGIPSEKQVTEKGVSVGEMQAALLAKVEELTLHLIRMERENQASAARVDGLQNRVSQLEHENAELKRQKPTE